jgi:LPXTG-site transpeptidase (sortase) family protein
MTKHNLSLQNLYNRLLLIFLLTFAVILCLLYYYHQRKLSHAIPANTAAFGININKNASHSQHKNLPIRLIIPGIQVNAAIEQVGITPEGAMAVPRNINNVGWYNPGPRPGERGGAVIAGHYDGENGAKGVFQNLHLLKIADKIYIEDSDGKMTLFIVKESRLYNPDADASTVFGQSDGSHLNLITCEGTWDQAQKSYSKRLVVFADAVR